VDVGGGRLMWLDDVRDGRVYSGHEKCELGVVACW